MMQLAWVIVQPRLGTYYRQRDEALGIVIGASEITHRQLPAIASLDAVYEEKECDGFIYKANAPIVITKPIIEC